MLALGRLISKHDDGATIGYVDVDASNVVVAFELIDCVLALVLVADNDVVEFDTFVVVVMTCSPVRH